MRFQNQTAVPQQICWTDVVNRRTQIIQPSQVVEGPQFAAWLRPVGPLTALLDDEAPHRRQYRRIDASNVRDLFPFFERSLRRLTKTSQVEATRWAAQAVKIWDKDSLFDGFFDKRAIAHVTNTTLPEDSVSVIVARLVEARVLRPTPPSPMEKPKTAAIMGRGIFERWRPTARTVISGQPRIEQGFSDERPSSNPGADVTDIHVEQWREFFVRRDTIENCLGRAIHQFVQGGIYE